MSNVCTVIFKKRFIPCSTIYVQLDILLSALPFVCCIVCIIYFADNFVTIPRGLGMLRNSCSAEFSFLWESIRELEVGEVEMEMFKTVLLL